MVREEEGGLQGDFSETATMCVGFFVTFMILIYYVIGQRAHDVKKYNRINTVYGGDIGRRFTDTQNGRFYRYETEYSIDDCMGLLSRENIYDICAYSFEKQDEYTAELTISYNMYYMQKPVFMGRGSTTLTLFRMEFEQREKTIITMQFVSERHIFQTPATPIMVVDEFMEKKLSARWINQ